MLISKTKKEELVLLKFTDKEIESKLKWKHSKEFEFEHQMYDIVSKEVKNGTHYYWCWSDNKETKLNQKLDQLLSSTLEKNTNNKNSKKRLNSLYKSLYCSKINNSKTVLLIYKNKLKPIADKIYVSIYNTPPAPPPKQT